MALKSVRPAFLIGLMRAEYCALKSSRDAGPGSVTFAARDGYERGWTRMALSGRAKISDDAYGRQVIPSCAPPKMCGRSSAPCLLTGPKRKGLRISIHLRNPLTFVSTKRSEYSWP
jgi:hypothetical protein